jgi:hypothetical protein
VSPRCATKKKRGVNARVGDSDCKHERMRSGGGGGGRANQASPLLEKGAHSSQKDSDFMRLGQTCKIKDIFGINISYCFVRHIEFPMAITNDRSSAVTTPKPDKYNLL